MDEDEKLPATGAEAKKRWSKGWNQWYQLSTLRNRYCRTENTLYVWRAIKYCSAEGITYPDWVHIYLAECADKLTSIESDPKKNDAAVAAAIGLKTRGGPWFTKQFEDAEEREFAVLLVESLKTIDPDRSEDEIFQEVANRRSKSKSTIRDWYYLRRTGKKYYDFK
jgi:hypothetical protein